MLTILVIFDAKTLVRPAHFTTFSNMYIHSKFYVRLVSSHVQLISLHLAWNVPSLGITSRVL
jgi:hypothetical protein